MKPIRTIAIACACALLVSILSMRVSARDEKPAVEKDAAAASFDAVRGLEGTWESDKPGHDGKPMLLVFKVTANGSVVTETMFPGSQHEMLNTYHMDGDTLMVTHYCANLQAHAGEGHMGALELTISGDKLIEKWGFLKPGEKEPVSFETFELHRKNG
jgi:hypothetical protein